MPEAEITRHRLKDGDHASHAIEAAAGTPLGETSPGYTVNSSTRILPTPDEVYVIKGGGGLHLALHYRDESVCMVTVKVASDG